MPRRKKFTVEQIIAKLCEAEVELVQGKIVPEVVRKLWCDGADVLPLEAGIRRPEKDLKVVKAQVSLNEKRFLKKMVVESGCPATNPSVSL